MRVLKPTAYIGPVGSLVPFLGPSTESISGGRGVSFSDTLGGRKAFMSPIRSREWSCDLDTRYPEELAGLQYIANYATPPFVWYPADALFGNMLTPAQGGLAPGAHNGADGPMVEVSPGVWLKSVFPDNSNAVSLPYVGGLLRPMPIMSGETLTFSAWLRGSTIDRGQVIAVVWRDVDGSNMFTENPTVGEGSTGWVRRSLSLTPPAGAAQVSFQFFAGQVAGPAVTLSGEVLPYSPGKGATKAVVHGLSESLILVSQYPNARDLSGLSFTVSEVG